MKIFDWLLKQGGDPAFAHLGTEELRELVRRGPRYRYICTLVDQESLTNPDHMTTLLTAFGMDGYRPYSSIPDKNGGALLILEAEVRD